ncbi:uncharacterized protein PpBr36_11080 [Pyricularia pennisetigena]|uniref:uncharacterized protein n=1 Tax=Pyricularia pennisetigena TaxID=1578925 RepID=UPI0011538934|nr:uncharacterized protein PpBr36_11080 [Pyricularia pennisetigena]TLS20644.1 hypothetical protein PpBr36_11080 [Pyricularia pennisetigena]
MDKIIAPDGTELVLSKPVNPPQHKGKQPAQNLSMVASTSTFRVSNVPDETDLDEQITENQNSPSSSFSIMTDGENEEEDLQLKCPTCYRNYPKSMLEGDGKARMEAELADADGEKRRQLCQAHLAVESVEANLKPVNWDTLERRVKRFHGHIVRINDGTTATEYTRQWDELNRSRAMRNGNRSGIFLRMPGCGIYGQRGRGEITSIILAAAADPLSSQKWLPEADSVYGSANSGDWLNWVLVPEVVVRLLTEDYKCTEEQARASIREYSGLGDELHPVEDVIV